MTTLLPQEMLWDTWTINLGHGIFVLFYSNQYVIAAIQIPLYIYIFSPESSDSNHVGKHVNTYARKFNIIFSDLYIRNVCCFA